MKTIKALLLSTCLVATFYSQTSGQSLDNFIAYDGLEILAELAHPGSDFEKGRYKIYKDAVEVEIYFTNGVYTKIRLGVSDGWFTSVDVIKDTDWFPPFKGVELIKNHFYKHSRGYAKSSVIKASYELWLNKTVEDFSGKDITLLMMTLSWSTF
ncbi:MAG: hypothetical protein ACI8VT_003482 [Saprospiraceae bacterium]|jgi:hypothetical protein